MRINGREVIAGNDTFNWFSELGPNYNEYAVTRRDLIASAIRTVIRSYPQKTRFHTSTGFFGIRRDLNEYAIGNHFVVTEFRVIENPTNADGDNVFISVQYQPESGPATSSLGGHYDESTNRMVWSIYAD